MNLLKRLWLIARGVPANTWIDAPVWLKDDAVAMQLYLKSESGIKLKLYLLNFVLRSQSEAISSSNNLEQKCGYCLGAKAILTQMETLAEPENFTDGDAEGS